MVKYHGDLDTLKSTISSHGLLGDWHCNEGKHTFKAKDGGILIWYRNGTLQCQGKDPSKSTIENAIQIFNASNHTITTNTTPPRLFIVYGHDETSRDQLELILSKTGISYFILSKTSGKGLTLIEALEEQVGKNGTANAGIVLLTPDDCGYAKRDGESTLKDRARQNVILEMGMLISKLGRSNTIILVKGNIERPSDTDGIIYHSYKNNIKEIASKIVERLETCGFNIDHKKVLEAIN